MIPRVIVPCAVTLLLLGPSVTHGQTSDLDPSFGENGRVATSLGIYSELRTLAEAPDGTLLAAGPALIWRGNTSDWDMAVARYSADGRLLASAAVDLLPGAFNTDSADCVAIRSDGRIVLAGATMIDQFGYAAALVQLLPDLTRDPSFGDNGVVVGPILDNTYVSGLAIRPDGRVIVAGAFGLMQYNPDGTPDTTFGLDGRLPSVWSASEALQDMALQGDGQIVVAGVIFSGGAGELALARLRSDGRFDGGFGANGKVYLNTYFAAATTVAVDWLGRILVGGVRFRNGLDDFALWRFDAAGRLDASFGTGGRVVTDVGGWDQPFALAEMPDGRLLLAGMSCPGFQEYSTCDGAVVRYAVDGTVDPTFATDGILNVDLLGGSDVARAMVVQAGGGIVVALEAGGADDVPVFGLVRYRHRPPNQPPILSPVEASRTILWPANHRFVDVQIAYQVTDDFDLAPACVLTVTSNEAIDGTGDGRSAADWEIVDAHHVRLRAERAGAGTGRVYSVVVTCVDSGGLEARREVSISVPLSRGGRPPLPHPDRASTLEGFEAGGSHRGPEPVQYQPANRVRAGRQQR